ncbi:NAD(P)H-hydrate dehydratase [Schnuerera sp. xch1]|uniref:NAD(P)H-hydrate dehydratase n=1 Tax=Schnuerera sp. xch1 TaxID=2874283 RepID=UPI001CBA9653|nr:NAD(P)H-hydrate dehydratase [Schnuerera sp. xch1]MBZ2176020.1 NAD(P)H-hydrate dehydratase [Schnuerera sp. xch1]
MTIVNGVDIIKVSRIENLLNKERDRFLNKIFTQDEIEYIKIKDYNSQTVSGLFAAKEAISKLLGTGVGKVNWKHMEILHDKKGKPLVKLHNKGYKISKALNIENIKLSITHENEYALAFVTGETIKCQKDIIIPKYIKRMLPKREKDSHKGTYGRVGIIAGSKGMTGAPYLSAMAALRSGSGLVYAIVPDAISNILSVKLTEAIIKPIGNNIDHFTMDSVKEILKAIEGMEALAIGPGMGTDEERIELVKEILLTFHKPVVIDADGINCISKDNPDVLLNRQEPTIITPHPGEMSKLVKTRIEDIQKNRVEYSKYVSNRYKIITVLKGAGTIVSSEKGEVYVNTTGNAGMATAGSGDVLTGVIAGFLGQNIDPYKAAILGVYCHGLAGDLAEIDKGQYGMIARDILQNIPKSINKIQPL